MIKLNQRSRFISYMIWQSLKSNIEKENREIGKLFNVQFFFFFFEHFPQQILLIGKWCKGIVSNEKKYKKNKVCACGVNFIPIGNLKEIFCCWDFPFGFLYSFVVLCDQLSRCFQFELLWVSCQFPNHSCIVA